MPAAKATEVQWAGFHTLRHASRHALRHGRSVAQVAERLGHKDPGFSLPTYVHLMEQGVGGALVLDGQASAVADAEPAGQQEPSKVATQRQPKRPKASKIGDSSNITGIRD